MIATENTDRIARCISLLQDDFERQSGYLSIDDVTRVLSRSSFSVNEIAAVWVGLEQAGIAVEGLDEEKIEDPFEEEECFSEAIDFCLTYPKVPLLNEREEIQLARRILAAKAAPEIDSPESKHVLRLGSEARTKLILSNIRLVFHCANHFGRDTTLESEDLVQEGIIGLFTAADKYDPEKGYRFSTYATWWIKQAMARAHDNTARIIRIPSHRLTQLQELRKKRRQLWIELGRQATVQELASELGTDLGEVELLLRVEKDASSLSTGWASKEQVRAPVRAVAPVGAPGARIEQLELQEILSRALGSLDERSRDILVHRFGLDNREPLTLEQLGAQFGLTRERIRQLEQAALARVPRTPSGQKLIDFLEEEDET